MGTCCLSRSPSVSLFPSYSLPYALLPLAPSDSFYLLILLILSGFYSLLICPSQSLGFPQLLLHSLHVFACVCTMYSWTCVHVQICSWEIPPLVPHILKMGSPALSLREKSLQRPDLFSYGLSSVSKRTETDMTNCGEPSSMNQHASPTMSYSLMRSQRMLP